MYPLTFAVRDRYPDDVNGIGVEVLLHSKDLFLRTTAKVDTGSRFCIFQRELAEALEIEVESGIRQKIRTVNGQFDTFGHELLYTVLDQKLTATLYFAAERDFPRNVLGRLGWLDRLRVAIVDYDRELFVADYNLGP